MRYVIFFDITSIILMLIIAYTYHYSKKVPLIANEAVGLLIWIIIGSCVTDLVAGVYSSFPEHGTYWGVFTCNLVYFLLRNMVPLTFAHYVFAIIQNRSRGQIILNILIGVNGVVSFILILANLFYPLLFYIDSENTYHRSNGIFFLYFFIGMSLFLLLLEIIIFGKNLEKRKKRCLIAGLLVPMVAWLIQLANPFILVEGFGIAIGLLFIYLNVSRPDQLIDYDTGLMNQDAFHSELNRIFSRQDNSSIIFAHISNLEFISNNYGIRFSAQLRTEMAISLRRQMGNRKLFYIGRGRFVVICGKNRKKKVERVAYKVNSILNHVWKVRGVLAESKAGTCVIHLPEAASSIGEIYNFFDCMVQEKISDKEHVFLEEEMMSSSIRRREEVEMAIDRAIENSSFQVYYQPIFSLENDQIESAEALLRLTDEKLGFISPEEFIPIAEHSGRILKIGEIVFESVCRFLAEGKITELGIKYIEVNLSVVECMQSCLSEKLFHMINQYHLNPSQINLEITETATADRIGMLVKNMSELHENGVTFSLDDYGTGYSNISYMMSLPFHIVKIDKSVLWSSMKNDKAMIALESIISMIRGMNMKILVEGVENEEMVNLLRELECNYLQGFYYSKPVPENEFISFMSAKKGGSNA